MELRAFNYIINFPQDLLYMQATEVPLLGVWGLLLNNPMPSYPSVDMIIMCIINISVPRKVLRGRHITATQDMKHLPTDVFHHFL